jgi:hypothetical protein
MRKSTLTFALLLAGGATIATIGAVDRSRNATADQCR